MTDQTTATPKVPGAAKPEVKAKGSGNVVPAKPTSAKPGKAVKATAKGKEPISFGKFTAHPAADLFPMMTGDPFAKLVDDVKANGVLEPIVVHDGQIVDGRNRYRAAETAGVEIKTRKLKDTELGDQTIPQWIISRNMRRRHLTAGQLAMLATKLEPMIAEAIKAREAARKAAGTPVTPANAPATPANPADRAAREARTQAGNAVGVSGRSVSTAKRVQREAPELAKEVEEGKRSLHSAEVELDGPQSVVTLADQAIKRLYDLTRKVRDDAIFREAFVWALDEDPKIRAELAALLELKPNTPKAPVTPTPATTTPGV